MAPDRGWLRSVSDYAATLGVTFPRPGLAGPAHVSRSCRWLGSRGGMCTRCALPARRSAVCPDPWGTISDLVEEFRDVDRATATTDAVLSRVPVSPARARRALDLLASVVPLNPNVVASLATIATEYPGTAAAEAASSLRGAADDMIALIQRRAGGGLYLPVLAAAQESETSAGAAVDLKPLEFVLALVPPRAELTGSSALLLATASPVLQDNAGRLALVPRVAAEECLPGDHWTALGEDASFTEALERTQDLAHVLPHVLTLAQQTQAPLTDLLDAVRHAHA